jgi:hypothetical protein
MFCPNCAARQTEKQNFCRSCGLELGQVARAMQLHGPSRERAAMERLRERVERLGNVSISIAGVIAVSLLLGIAGYYKLVLFGPGVLIWSAVGALVGFVLLAVVFLGYSKLFLTESRANGEQPDDKQVHSAATGPLLADKPIDDIPSVTESSTELLERLPRTRRR